VFGEPEKLLRRMMEDLEGQTARAMEQLVAGEGFGELMARFTGNTVALTKISGDVMELVLRNLGLAGRTSIAWRASWSAPRTSWSCCSKRSNGWKAPRTVDEPDAPY
jgi:hypothetical protein